MAEVTVLGAGVVGMTSAYALARKGHSVTVVDSASSPAEAGASFGNGAQLSYSYTDALASPSLVADLPKYILGLDPAFRLRIGFSPEFWSWALSFLANASANKFERNTTAVLKLAMESRRELAEISGKVEFDHRATGKLHLYSTHEALLRAKALSRLKNRCGAQQAVLTPEEAVDREPALGGYQQTFVGALWSPLDEAGDSWRFCQSLRHLLQAEYGVTFRLGTTVRALKTLAGKLVALETDAGEFECNRAVIALGVWSRQIARTAGIKLPIWPMQGYSMTIPATTSAPDTSITDNSRKIVFCRLGERLRIAGIADIGACYGEFRQGRFDRLLRAAKDIFPQAGDYTGKVNAWTGLRPMTPDSQPIVGRSNVEGVFLNCGHGSLGWTLSMGTAVRLAEAIK